MQDIQNKPVLEEMRYMFYNKDLYNHAHLISTMGKKKGDPNNENIY